MAAGRDIRKRSVKTTRFGNVENMQQHCAGMSIQYLFLHAINKGSRKH